MKPSLLLLTGLLFGLTSCKSDKTVAPSDWARLMLPSFTIQAPPGWRKETTQCTELCAQVSDGKNTIFVDYGPFAYRSVEQVIKDAKTTNAQDVEAIVPLEAADQKIATRSILIHYKPYQGKNRNGFFIERKQPKNTSYTNQVALYGTYEGSDADLIKIYRSFRFEP